MIKIDVKKGDTILTGKFKNKKTVIKDIGTDEHGMPTINGRKVVTFRIHKRVNIFDDITKEEIEEFLISTNIKDIIKESSALGFSPSSGWVGPVDDGPRYFWGNQNSYRTQADTEASKLGWKVVDYIINDPELEKHDTEYPEGPPSTVTYFPAGAIDKPSGTYTIYNKKGVEAYSMWLDNIQKAVEAIGFKIVDFLDAKRAIKSSKNEPTSLDDPKSGKPDYTEPRGEKDQHKEMEELEENYVYRAEIVNDLFSDRWLKEATSIISKNA